MRLRRYTAVLLVAFTILFTAQPVWSQQPVVLRGSDSKDVESLLFSADGKSLYAGFDYSKEASLAKFDLAKPTAAPAVLAKSIIAVDHLFLDAAANRLICGDIGGDMKEWDLTADSLEPAASWKFSADKGLVPAITITPDGKHFVASHPQDLKIVTRGAREVVRTLKGHTKDVDSVAVSADGKYIASAGDHEKVRVWEFSGKQLGEFRITHALLAYSPAENLVAFQGVVSEADFDIHLIEVPSMKVRGKLKTGYFQLSSITFSPDGSMIAAGSEKGDVIIWNAATGQQLTKLADSAAAADEKNVWVRSLAFSADSQMLATGGKKGLIKVYPLAALKPAAKPGGAVATKPGVTPTPMPAKAGPTDFSTQTVRIWRSSNGKFSIKAKLIALAAGVASLETEDGRVLKVPAAKLGFRERKYLKELE